MLENKLFEALLDVIPFKAYAVDVETYEVVYANKLMRENMYAPQETYCWEQVFGQQHICSWCNIEKLKARDKKVKNKEKLICEFFDETDDRWLKSYDELISWPDGRDVKYSILVDITDQKEIQGDMIKSHAKLAMHSKHLKQTNKNLQITKLTLQKTVNELNEQKAKAELATASKSQFLANMSHEIRTPMNAVIGLTHLLGRTKLDQKQQDYVNKIENSSKNLLSIINDILDFSKIEAGRLELEKIQFNLAELIEEIESVIEDQIFEKGLEFSIKKDYLEKDYFLGDPTKISQILVNLLNNAIKFTQDGKIELRVSIKNQRAVFEVEDTGIGLTVEQKNKLFDSFTQADLSTTRKYGGTGLGLSISKQIAHLMDGEIFIESEFGVGSKFIVDVSLPKLDNFKIEKSLENDFETLKNRLDTLGKKNILLAEDNSLNQEIIVGLLEDTAFELDVSQNGLEALKLFEKYPKKYDLILMDIQMPVMDGFEATSKIRQIDSKIPIIALSANAMKEEIEKTKSININDYITKPIDVKKLYLALLNHLSFGDKQIEETLLFNKEKSLELLGGKEKLFDTILNKFHDEYKDIDLSKEEDEEKLKIFVHTLKGLAGNISSSLLQNLCLQYETTQDKSLLQKIEEIVKKIVLEIEIQSTNDNKTIEKNNNQLSIDEQKLIEVLESLYKALKSRRPKESIEILNDLDNYMLDEELIKSLEEVKVLSKKYQFKEAVEVLENYL